MKYVLCVQEGGLEVRLRGAEADVFVVRAELIPLPPAPVRVEPAGLRVRGGGRGSAVADGETAT